VVEYCRPKHARVGQATAQFGQRAACASSPPRKAPDQPILGDIQLKCLAGLLDLDIA
jgi:hypothetical protein